MEVQPVPNKILINACKIVKPVRLQHGLACTFPNPINNIDQSKYLQPDDKQNQIVQKVIDPEPASLEYGRAVRYASELSTPRSPK
jgi:hypothetical protein